MPGLSEINRALTLVPKRAESRQAEQLRDTFVDSGIAAALASVDHQVVFGRRGTGKTHALRYLAATVESERDVALYSDLRTVGSPGGLFAGDSIDAAERAARLMRDLLHQVFDALLEMAVNEPELSSSRSFMARLERLLDAIGTVSVDGSVEIEESGTTKQINESGASASLEGGGRGVLGKFGLTKKKASDVSDSNKSVRRGQERVGLNFTDLAKAIRELASELGGRRVWLLLDEWSSVPSAVQPFLAEFLVRCILPLQQFTVKIASIEQQTHLRGITEDGDFVGIEIGADVAANLDLDEFMVFELSEDRAREFFLGLFFKHLTSGAGEGHEIADLNEPQDLIRLGFTDRRAFDELVRAAEGVPRDAINIASKAALKALDRKISVADVRGASRAWYHSDKEAALKSLEAAQDLLNWVIDEVIRGRRARGFLVNRRDAGNELLVALFEARVLHLVRRGYSAQDEPGERYDVYVIDYGAYVDLIQTKFAPQGMLPGIEEETFSEVPVQDLRAIRRAILDLERFFSSREQSE